MLLPDCSFFTLLKIESLQGIRFSFALQVICFTSLCFLTELGSAQTLMVPKEPRFEFEWDRCPKGTFRYCFPSGENCECIPICEKPKPARCYQPCPNEMERDENCNCICACERNTESKLRPKYEKNVPEPKLRLEDEKILSEPKLRPKYEKIVPEKRERHCIGD